MNHDINRRNKNGMTFNKTEQKCLWLVKTQQENGAIMIFMNILFQHLMIFPKTYAGDDERCDLDVGDYDNMV